MSISQELIITLDYTTGRQVCTALVDVYAYLKPNPK